MTDLVPAPAGGPEAPPPPKKEPRESLAHLSRDTCVCVCVCSILLCAGADSVQASNFFLALFLSTGIGAWLFSALDSA